MARSWSGAVFALLLAGCTGPNSHYMGVVDAPGEAARGGAGGAGAGTGGAAGAPGGTGGALDAPDAPLDRDGVEEPSPDTGAEVADGPPIVTDMAVPPEAPAEVALEVPAGPVCGTDRPDISGIVASDGLAVGLDGTIYYTTTDDTNGYIGRLRPGAGMKIEKTWLTLVNEPITWGLALDTARKKLYFASDTTIFGFDLGFDPPLRFSVGSKLTNINDLVVAADGSLFLSVQSDRHIYRVPQPNGVMTRVSVSPIGTVGQNAGPAALAFGPDGALFIGLAGKSAIVRMVLNGTVERSRANFGSFTGWGNGLAFDNSGRLYVGLWDDAVDNEIALLSATGATAGKVVTKGRFASMAFGRGALDCRDLYVANPLGPMRRVETDTPGLPAP